MKKIIVFLCVISLLSFSFSAGTIKKTDKNKPSVITTGSTSWSAAFADIAGLDDAQTIAPVYLRHPPEYEITTSDVLKILESDFFIYAGFERMMKTLGSKVGEGKTVMIQIEENNSLETVKNSTLKIAKAADTLDKQAERYAEYEKTILDGKEMCRQKGLTELKVLVNKNQRFLAKDLGLNIQGTFGPGSITSEQLLDAKEKGYDLIIDNVHNPVGKPFLEVIPDAKYINWRNFPETVEKNALKNVISANIIILESL